MVFSEGFQKVNDFTFDISLRHPKSVYRELLFEPQRFVEIDKRPGRDLRAQFSYGSEGGQTASTLTVVETKPVITEKKTLGRISLTGKIEIRELRGWHVFDLMPDGTIDNFESPTQPGREQQTTLSDAEVDELAAWLETNHSIFWAA